jgi:hypothetical protein
MHQDGAVGGNRRHRGPRPLEQHQVGSQSGRQVGRGGHIGQVRLAQQAAAAAPGAHRRHPRQGGVLEKVRRRVLARPRPLQQIGHADGTLPAGHEFRLGRAAAAHRHHRDLAAPPRQHAGGVPGDGGLADPLAGADHRQHGDVDPRAAGRAEVEVRSRVFHAGRQGVGDQDHPPGLVQHRLVREVEHPLGAVAAGRRHQRGRRVAAAHPLQRHPVVGVAGELLLAAQEQRRHHLGVAARVLEGGPDDRRVVLPVHQGEHARSHQVGACGSGTCFS